MDPKTNLITTVYQDTINTSNSQNILWGVPTRVNYVGPGLDDNNLLILMTLTLPKGAKDIKNSMILGNATTYQVIISRVIGATLKPFTVQDYYYGKKQAGSTNYYDYQLYTISSQVDTNGVSALNQIMSNLICLEISWLLKVHVCGQHVTDKTQIWISTYKYPKNANSTYALEFEYDRVFREN